MKEISCAGGCAVDFQRSLVESTKTDTSKKLFEIEHWLDASNAETLRFAFMLNGCEDNVGILEGQENSRWYTLRHVARNKNALNCADVSDYCDQNQAALVRMPMAPPWWLSTQIAQKNCCKKQNKM